MDINTVHWYSEGELLRYHTDLAIEDLGAKRIYQGEVLGVARYKCGNGY